MSASTIKPDTCECTTSVIARLFAPKRWFHASTSLIHTSDTTPSSSSSTPSAMTTWASGRMSTRVVSGQGVSSQPASAVTSTSRTTVCVIRPPGSPAACTSRRSSVGQRSGTPLSVV